MTAIKPTDSELRDKIKSDSYNDTLNDVNAKYAEMDNYISNLESDIEKQISLEEVKETKKDNKDNEQ